MGSLEYEPIDLEQHSFRLIRLIKGAEGLIQCELFHAILDDPESVIEYEALSYTWGGAEKPSHIEVNGRKTFPVTVNLHLALQRLRSPLHDRILWIDALCIDQSNDKERGHQVRQMGSIYKRAEQVVIWLGEATAETNHFLHHMNLLGTSLIQYAYYLDDWKNAQKLWWSSVARCQLPGRGNCAYQQREGLRTLLSRSWFRRVWIIQEVANARAAKVMCGSEAISARIFALIPSLMDIVPDSHCQAILDIMPGPSRKDSWYSQRHDLNTLLVKFQASEASEPRDKIFALLGISSDASDYKVLVPNYETSEQQVVQTTMRFLPRPDFQECELLSRWLQWSTVPDLLHGVHCVSSEAFVWAVVQGNQTVVKKLLQRNDVDMNYKSTTNNGMAPLTYAAANGDIAMVKLLLHYGANINTYSRDYSTPSQVADASTKDRGSIEWDLIGNVNMLLAQSKKSGDMLRIAARNGTVQAVMLLLERGADFNSDAIKAATSWSTEQEYFVRYLLDILTFPPLLYMSGIKIGCLTKFRIMIIVISQWSKVAQGPTIKVLRDSGVNTCHVLWLQNATYCATD